ncbi:hypothetical protein LJB42_004319 [Komagataella kurtzmanii]|nr:hypothetical protein LJB42_004319 [Komagataella kurtzmanii]
MLRSIARQLHTISVDNSKPPLLILASIGNPESSFRGTRHSIGHHILNRLKQIYQADEQLTIDKNKFYYNRREEPQVLFYQSNSLMNLSGKPISKAFKSVHKWTDEYNPVLVILHDELDCPVGKFKTRRQMSSHRGHNGLRSINQHMGGGFTTISIGIDRPESKSSNAVASYVLAKVPPHDLERIDRTIPSIQKTVEDMKLGKLIFDTNPNYKG